MGALYSHTCDTCGFVVRTSGLWEFYRDRDGNRKMYGHPGPRSKEAEKAGVHGMSAELYCIDCGKTRDLIVVEYKKPAETHFEAWLRPPEPKGPYARGHTPKCPECGTTNFLLGPCEGRIVPCPKCKEGKLIGRMTLIS